MTQRFTKKGYDPLSEKEEFTGRSIVNIAYSIHQALGPGLLESIYTKCFMYEMDKRRLSYTNQQPVKIIYDQLVLDGGLRLDLLVENLVIVEIKAQENYHKVWEAQLLSYLRMTNKRLGFLINFHVPIMKEGIKRMIL